MLELEDAPLTGGAGFMPLPKVTVDDVDSVLRLAIRADERGNDIEMWAEKLDEADLFACLDSQMKAAVLYAVMTTNSAYMSRVQEYVRFKIGEELEGS
ncbi:hypothetical protein PT7_P011 (plasmid) [Pusillimonas sp. T7-7]|uniref:hypothetical protein n=1 Tax=Pusillimonas sp. (strain T7-7) TaxID=1007105 RepID=UPI0002084A82|nr:hypothetical protein [Pusillimonas sp. T7-7]AEC22247.1 hypothetical protein PT7_P011 [Pusillimonas sp. T7-7]